MSIFNREVVKQCRRLLSFNFPYVEELLLNRSNDVQATNLHTCILLLAGRVPMVWRLWFLIYETVYGFLRYLTVR